MPRLSLGLALGVLLAAPAAPALAQASFNGSLYSRYGLGEQVNPGSVQGLTLGGGGLALAGYGYANHANPAALGQQYLTRFALVGSLQTLGIEDGAGTRASRTEAQLDGATLAFPLRTGRVGLGVQYTPVTRTSYGAVTRSEAIGLPDAPDDTVAYEVGFEGAGGLHRLEVGGGVRVAKPLYLGVALGGTFGLIEQSRRTTFAPTDAAGYAEQVFQTSTRLAGFSARAGALLTLDSLGGRGQRLNVAATVELPTTLYGRRTVALAPLTLVNPDTLASTPRGTVKLPLAVALGVAYTPTAKWTVVADGRYEPWSSFESDFAFDGYSAGGAQNRMVDRVRVSAGAELLPGAGEYAPRYWRRVAYRVGGYYDSGYVTAPNATGGAGDRLPTLGLTAGLSLPALLPGTTLDLGLEVGQRGTAQTSPVPLVQDRFVKVSLLANIGERWFERPRLN